MKKTVVRENITLSDSRVTITHTRKKYNLLWDGTGYEKKPAETIIKTVTPEFYAEFINDRAAFVSRVQYSNTAAGYLPTKIITYVPFVWAAKYVDTFTVEYKQ